MLNDVYRGYMESDYGFSYRSELRNTRKYKENEDYALGVDLSNSAYFLTISDTSREWEADSRRYNEVREKINKKYPNTVNAPEEHWEYPFWKMRVFNSPDLQVAKRVSFVTEFIDAKATELDRRSIMASSNAQRFKIDYFNFIEKPVAERIKTAKDFEYVLKQIESRYSGILNKNLMDYVLDYHISSEKLLQVDTVFNVSEGSFLENSILRWMDITPIQS